MFSYSLESTARTTVFPGAEKDEYETVAEHRMLVTVPVMTRLDSHKCGDGADPPSRYPDHEKKVWGNDIKCP